MSVEDYSSSQLVRILGDPERSNEQLLTSMREIDDVAD